MVNGNRQKIEEISGLSTIVMTWKTQTWSNYTFVYQKKVAWLKDHYFFLLNSRSSRIDSSHALLDLLDVSR